MKSILVAGILLALSVVPSLAGEEDGRAAALARGAAFLAELRKTEPVPSGTQCFGMYLNGTKSLGVLKYSLGAAPEGSGGAYLAVLELEMAFGPQKFTGRLEALLDATFALRSRTSVETREMPEGKLTKKETNRREGDAWIYEADINWEKVSHRIATDEPDHWMLPSLLPLAAKLCGAEAGTFILRGIHWPKPEESDEPPPEVKDVVVTVGAPEKVAHRGAEVEARRIGVVKTGDESMEVLVGAGGKVLAVTQKEVPLVLVAGTEEECRKDLPGKEGGEEARGASSPKEAVMVYLRVLAKEVPVDALQAVLHWEALHEELAAENEAIAKLGPEEFKAALLEGFAGQEAGFTAEQLAAVEPLIEVVEEGDEAKVTIPELKDRPFHVRRTETGWKITRFPR